MTDIPPLDASRIVAGTFADLHAQAVELLARRLPEGLPHPNKPDELLTFPGFAFHTMPEQMREAVVATARMLCEAIVTEIETGLDAVITHRPPVAGEK